MTSDQTAMLDISDKTNPILVANLDTDAYFAYINNSILFLFRNNFITVYRINDNGTPILISNSNQVTVSRLRKVAIRGQYLFVLDGRTPNLGAGSDRLIIFDIRDLNNINFVLTY
jgi:hypothetical protein